VGFLRLNPIAQNNYFAMIEVGLSYGISNNVFAEISKKVKGYFESDFPQVDVIISGITDKLSKHSEMSEVTVKLLPEYIFPSPEKIS
jgi:hypothetical protein